MEVKKIIIIFGASGYIGQEFLKQLCHKNNIEVYAWKDTTHTTLNDLYRWRYKYINRDIFAINCAGYIGLPNADACEIHKDLCISGNIIWPTILTNWCENCNIPFGHVTTGCIYNGLSPNSNGWNENDEPNFSFKFNNCSFYSGTKVVGEEIVKRYNKAYIWRLRLPFCEENHKRNYFNKLLSYKKFLICKNSISNKNEFVSACIKSFFNKVPYGIYNITNPGYIDMEWLVDCLAKTVAPDKKFELVNEDILYSEGLIKVPRPSCILDVSKLKSVGIELTPIKESILECLKKFKINYKLTAQ